MMGSRAFRAVAGLVVAGLLTVLVAPGAQAQGRGNGNGNGNGNGGGIQIRTNQTAAVVAGDTAWITVSIRARSDVDDVRFTATLDGQPVSYPENTVDHSGPYKGYDLDRQETDYVAFKITAPQVQQRETLALELLATWTEDGSPRTANDSVRVPVVAYSGEPFALVTDSVSLTEADNGWVRLGFAGLAPQVDDVRVSIVEPAGLDIHYPQETYTSLLRDAVLEDGETDEAHFRLGEAHWGPGLAVEIQVDYLIGDVAESRRHRVTIDG